MDLKYLIFLFVSVIAITLVGFFNIVDFYKSMQKDFATESITTSYANGNFLFPEIHTYNDLTSTKELNLDVNERLVYKITITHLSSDLNSEKRYLEIFLSKIFGFGKREVLREEYFVKRIDGDIIELELNADCRHTDKHKQRNYKLLLNKSSGKIVNVSEIFIECPADYQLIPEKEKNNKELNIYSNFLGVRFLYMYSPWMSLLNENFSWTQILKRNMTLNTTGIVIIYKNKSSNISSNKTILHCSSDEIITKYNVLGTDYVKGRKCFKIKAVMYTKGIWECLKAINLSDNRTTFIDILGIYLPGTETSQGIRKRSAILWVDYDKRILLKSEGFDEDRNEIYEVEIEKWQHPKE